MGQLISFANRNKRKISDEEKKILGREFQNHLQTLNELKKLEKETEWKIRVKCKKEIAVLDTLRLKLQKVNQHIQALTHKLNPATTRNPKPKG